MNKLRVDLIMVEPDNCVNVRSVAGGSFNAVCLNLSKHSITQILGVYINGMRTNNYTYYDNERGMMIPHGHIHDAIKIEYHSAIQDRDEKLNKILEGHE